MHKRRSRLAVLGVLATVMAVALLATSALGYRLDWWSFATAYRIFDWAIYLAGAGLLLGVAGLLVARPGAARRGRVVAALAVILALPPVIIGVNWEYAVRAYPFINDISTDTDDPPAFRAIPSAAIYPGAATAARQHAAYPDVKPLTVRATPEQAFDLALGAARDMGWQIVAADRLAGQIEAVATTRLFGFKDNVAVRIRPENGHARLDVRSHSRIGRSDLGTNAKRIRRYLKRLEQHAPG